MSLLLLPAAALQLTTTKHRVPRLVKTFVWSTAVGPTVEMSSTGFYLLSRCCRAQFKLSNGPSITDGELLSSRLYCSLCFMSEDLVVGDDYLACRSLTTSRSGAHAVFFARLQLWVELARPEIGPLELTLAAVQLEQELAQVFTQATAAL